MKRFQVRYYECYEGYYEVEANTGEEAMCKVMDDIAEGKRDDPDQCFDSGVEVEEME